MARALTSDDLADVAALLDGDEDRAEWAAVVADVLSAFEWDVVAALYASRGVIADAASLADTSPRFLRAAWGRVGILSSTSRATVAARDAGACVSVEACGPGEDASRGMHHRLRLIVRDVAGLPKPLPSRASLPEVEPPAGRSTRLRQTGRGPVEAWRRPHDSPVHLPATA